MQDLDIPKAKGSQVVVKVHSSGVCHSDIHLWEGGYEGIEGQFLKASDRSVSYPLTPGHEIPGTIESLGEEAAKEAIRLANDSKFGLGASIWTQDLDKSEKLSKVMESGIVTVNNVVISDSRVPFGGIKNNGFGREMSRYGMLEFVNIKSFRFYDQLIHDHHVE